MTFKIEKNVSKVMGKLIYRREENSFDFAPKQSTDISLLFGYLSLDICSESMLA